MQERQPSAPAKESGKSAKVPPAAKPAVASFTPAPNDPGYEENPVAPAKEEFDLKTLLADARTYVSWLEAGRVDGSRKDAQIVAANLMEGVRWIEQEA